MPIFFTSEEVGVHTEEVGGGNGSVVTGHSFVSSESILPVSRPNHNKRVVGIRGCRYCDPHG